MESASLSWNSFTPKRIIKQPFNVNAQCHKDYFPSVCVQSYARSDTVNSVKLLTRVAILSGGHVPQVPQWQYASDKLISDRAMNRFLWRSVVYSGSEKNVLVDAIY